MTNIDKRIIITKNKKNDINGNNGIKIINKNFHIFSDVSNSSFYNQREFRNETTGIINNEVKNKVPNELVLYFDFYLNAKKDVLKHTTIQKIKVIANRLKKFCC